MLTGLSGYEDGYPSLPNATGHTFFLLAFMMRVMSARSCFYGFAVHCFRYRDHWQSESRNLNMNICR